MQLGSTGWPTLFLTAWTSEAMRDTEQGVQPHCPQLRDLKYYSGKRCFSKSFYVVSNISGKINHSSGPKTEVRVSKLQSPGPVAQPCTSTGRPPDAAEPRKLWLMGPGKPAARLGHLSSPGGNRGEPQGHGNCPEPLRATWGRTRGGSRLNVLFPNTHFPLGSF